MAERKLRDGLWTSPRFGSVHTAEAQLLFVKLITIVDDFGCFDGRPEVISNRAYPVGGLPPELRGVFEDMIHDLHRADLIVRYLNGGRPFIAIPRWSHGYRLKRDFPAPPINVDVRDVKLRGKYGKPIDWRNPEGCEEVSILLDTRGEPLTRQPPEWRRVGSDYSPLPVTRPVTAVTAVTAVTKALVTAPVTAPVTAQSQAYDVTSLRCNDVTKPTTLTPKTVTEQAQVTAQSLPPPPTANGIRLSETGWQGVSEAQVLAWQEMFDGLSIPDQLDRSAQWLLANPKERTAYEQQADGLRAFIVRWLLRESRPAQH